MFTRHAIVFAIQHCLQQCIVYIKTKVVMHNNMILALYGMCSKARRSPSYMCMFVVPLG